MLMLFTLLPLRLPLGLPRRLPLHIPLRHILIPLHLAPRALPLPALLPLLLSPLPFGLLFLDPLLSRPWGLALAPLAARRLDAGAGGCLVSFLGGAGKLPGSCTAGGCRLVDFCEEGDLGV